MKLRDMTAEEREFVQRFAASQKRFSRIGFFASVLFAPLAVAAYGAVQRDYMALLVAFLGLAGFVGWVVVHDISGGEVLQSICAKLVTENQ
jgi:hypothetical protein